MKLEICITINNKKYRWVEHFTDLKKAFRKALKDLANLLGN